jgi:hypothetical protein
MKQFCEEVLKYLKSEYDDSYEFEIKCWLCAPPRLGVPNNEKAELSIKMGRGYEYILTDKSMYYLFGCYRDGEYIGERNQYRWQKELIDMIEGG